MPRNITVIFSDGSRETFTQVDDSLADENPPVKFIALVRAKYPNKKIAKLEKGEPSTVTAPVTPGVPAGKFQGDKGRWEDLGTGYLHNIDTHQIKLK